jgi:hypothetical protein
MPRQSNDSKDQGLFDSAQFRLVNFLIARYSVGPIVGLEQESQVV